MVLEPTPQTLNRFSPSEVWAWLQDIWTNNLKATADINWWLGLAESASHYVFYTKHGELKTPNLEWAQITVALYEYLDTVKHCETCGRSGMFIRLRLIRIFGHQPNDELLDAEKIIAWFYKNLSIDQNEVKKMIPIDLAEIWKQNPEKLLMLREIKNRLGVVQLLQEMKVFELDENLKEWISLRKSLP
jgi:hypothetical protein